jgi:hypothetical protein
MESWLDSKLQLYYLGLMLWTMILRKGQLAVEMLWAIILRKDQLAVGVLWGIILRKGQLAVEVTQLF